MTTPYPFTAIVGQDDLRLALLLNAVSPAVGGVLVRGEKGTAKSTAVRALATLLPEVAAVAGCRFSCDPDAPDPNCPDGPHGAGPRAGRPARMVELPVGASEDRVVGSLDLERALGQGVKAYEPGLLAAAHRGLTGPQRLPVGHAPVHGDPPEAVHDRRRPAVLPHAVLADEPETAAGQAAAEEGVDERAVHR